MKAISTFCIFLLMGLTSFAQLGKKLNEFTETNIANVAIDRLGEFYFQFQDQSIKKYDTEGKYLCQYQPRQDSITSLHPWNPLNVFAYDRHKQTLLFLDRSLTSLRQRTIDSSLAIEPFLACAGNNNETYWLYDMADLSLKKIGLANETVLLEIDLKKVFLNQTPELVYMRDYQNLLFLLDRKTGIKIISITGKQIDSIPSAEIYNFSFMGEELYYLDQGKLVFYDLYTKQQRKIPVDRESKFALATDERIILVGKSGKVSVWEFKP